MDSMKPNKPRRSFIPTLTRSQLQEVLAEEGYPGELNSLTDKSIVALIALGGHPEGLLSAALIIIPTPVREELISYGLVVEREHRVQRRRWRRQTYIRRGWEITKLGRLVILALAAAAPQQSQEEIIQDRLEFDAEIQEDIKRWEVQ